MSQSSYNSLALNEILLSISNSLNEAQQQLRNMPPYDEYGRPNTMYQLPYLDFNLEVISQFESSEMVKANENKSLAQANKINALRFVPFRSAETATKDVGTITSTISGRFVAIMPNEGLQPVFISCNTKIAKTHGDTNEYLLTVKLFHADNSPVTGQRIEVNFDEETSKNLSSNPGIGVPVFTTEKDGFTSQEGTFSVGIDLNKTQINAGHTYVFVANSANLFSSVAINKD